MAALSINEDESEEDERDESKWDDPNGDKNVFDLFGGIDD